MLAVIAPAPQPAGAVKWEIGGDAACESRRKGGGLEGLGAFFYGVWWSVPLDSVEGLRGLHITCLELIELGLGVVIAGPWVERARCVRLCGEGASMTFASPTFSPSPWIQTGTKSTPAPRTKPSRSAMRMKLI